MTQSIAAPGRHPLFNADAGDHPLPDDPREIDAVLQATQRCYDQHPYFIFHAKLADSAQAAPT